ncbi:MAG TPA: glycosyltransferase [Thermoanaerobaculia bacterium]|nr:glycosyltransferase [Thermoanaerobaculia bacterium]
MRTVEVSNHTSLAEYSDRFHLEGHVRTLEEEAKQLLPSLSGRKVWMINAAESGGGVAEMMPKLVSILRELGIEVEWVVIESERPEFFGLTKRIHNLIHDAGDPGFSAEDRALYEAVNEENARALERMMSPRDFIVAHDPQPCAMGAILKERTGAPAIWRSHIGLDRATPRTRSAWEFLRPWIEAYDRVVFSVPEYVPPFLADRSSIIHPGIDPLSPKNAEISPRRVQSILCSGQLALQHSPMLHPLFEHPALRLSAEGKWERATEAEEIGFLFRPIITQISRWDRLKGWEPLMDAFVRMKSSSRTGPDGLHNRCLDIIRLVLAGPDPASVADDPEGKDLLEELTRRWLDLDPRLQRDIAILTLPMASREENALMVNAIQRCSTIVVQNSIEEGFGLTVSEAMWKRLTVIGSSAAGIRQQIRDGVDGILIPDAENTTEIATILDRALANPALRGHLSGNAQRKVHENFLVFTQVRAWLRVLHSVLTPLVDVTLSPPDASHTGASEA